MKLTTEQCDRLEHLLNHLVVNMWRDSDDLEIGRDISDVEGVKIIFDGYGYNEETDEQDDVNHESYAIFIHKNSATEPFPEHALTPWALVHRPREEACFYVWYDAIHGEWEFVNTYDNDSELDETEFMLVVEALITKYYPE